jgi:hypothetical protein
MHCVKITWYPVNAGVTHLKDLIADTAAAIMYEQIAFVSRARCVLAAALSPYRAKSLGAVYALLVQHSAPNLSSPIVLLHHVLQRRASNARAAARYEKVYKVVNFRRLVSSRICANCSCETLLQAQGLILLQDSAVCRYYRRINEDACMCDR